MLIDIYALFNFLKINGMLAEFSSNDEAKIYFNTNLLPDIEKRNLPLETIVERNSKNPFIDIEIFQNFLQIIENEYPVEIVNYLKEKFDPLFISEKD